MKARTGFESPVPASAVERGSIRALKNWLLQGPGGSPLQDQIVRLRIADAIARLAPGHPIRKATKMKRRMRGAARSQKD